MLRLCETAIVGVGGFMRLSAGVALVTLSRGNNYN